MFARQRLKRETDAARETFLREAAPLAARCFEERVEDLLLADDKALTELGGGRAAELRVELRSLIGSFAQNPGRWDARRWPHRDRHSRELGFSCWDQWYVQQQAAEWLAERSPVKLPLASKARIRPMRATREARRYGMGGAKGALLEVGVGAAFKAFSAARTARAQARLDKLSAHRSYEPSPGMVAAEETYNRLLGQLRQMPRDPVERSRRREERREQAQEAERAAREACRQEKQAEKERRVQEARDAFRDS